MTERVLQKPTTVESCQREELIVQISFPPFLKIQETTNKITEKDCEFTCIM